MKKTLVAILILMLLALSSCEQSPTKTTKTPSPTPRPTTVNPFGDGGLLSKEPCGPPCFYGITPGITTREEATALLNSESSIFEGCESFKNSAYSSLEGINCNDYDFSISFTENIVDTVVFVPGLTITLEEIITTYGEPDRLFAFSTARPEDPFYGEVLLCFDSTKMTAFLPMQEGAFYNVSPKSSIENFSYSTDAEYWSVCNDYGRQTWEGYGEYPVQ